MSKRAMSSERPAGAQRVDDRLAAFVAVLEPDLLRVLTDAGERVRVAAETMYQALIAELSATIGARPSERSPSRANQRNGSRSRTQAGDLALRIPESRTGSFFPALLSASKGGPALFAAIKEAYLHGVSTSTVDDLSRPAGSPRGFSKS